MFLFFLLLPVVDLQCSALIFIFKFVSHIGSSTRSKSDIKAGTAGAAAAVPETAAWREPDASHCHSRWFTRSQTQWTQVIRHSTRCVFLVTFVICFTHRVVKAVGLQFLQGFIRHLNQCFFLLCGDSRCSLCPEKWLWWMGRCYFFSVGLQENRQWNESAEFCRQHNSSLVVIEDSAEMVNAPCTSHVNHTHLQFWSCTYQNHFKLLRTFGPLYFTASLQFFEICKPFFIHSL